MKPTSNKIEIELEYGSEFQKEFVLTVTMLSLQACKMQADSKHKDNRMRIKLDGITLNGDIPFKYEQKI